ncbi:polyamine aminopropyltransferase [Algihabitans albus]|uniref:polyamine aminopropyltransferase n=1 Tax=Algihabitans albus TaxID=2164067 RepID=UPI000E5D0127|nr:polyamine aminopropyltransferase [Algihabitans albus]
MSSWFRETLHRDYESGLRIEEVLFEAKSEHQHLLLFRNSTFGRVLTLDGVVQTTEADEFIYHEMLAHLPILAHGGVERVLIIGGGDGGMLEEVLKHRGVTQAVQVEIDASVVDFAKTHLRAICGAAYEDPRTELVIADGLTYVAETERRFDLIIVDSTDPIGPGEVLFTERFYADCKGCLAAGGVLVTQNGVPFLQPEELKQTLGFFRRLFADTTCYLATVPTYAGGPMAFGWATDDASLRKVPLETLQARFSAAGIDTRYYTPAVHLGALALPPYVAELVG